MRYSLRRVWNTPKDRAIADALLHPDYAVRRRGRGPRNSKADWQSLPQSKAAYLTYYFTPKDRAPYTWEPMAYFEMVGTDTATGKPRIRHLPPKRPKTTQNDPYSQKMR